MLPDSLANFSERQGDLRCQVTVQGFSAVWIFKTCSFCGYFRCAAKLILRVEAGIGGSRSAVSEGHIRVVTVYSIHVIGNCLAERHVVHSKSQVSKLSNVGLKHHCRSHPELASLCNNVQQISNQIALLSNLPHFGVLVPSTTLDKPLNIISVCLGYFRWGNQRDPPPR